MEPDTNTQPIPPTTQQAPIQPPAPEKHTSPILLWLLILTLVGVASYFGYQNWQLKQQFSHGQPIPTISTTPTTIPNPTAGWQTYADPKYGFSIQYPSSWQLIKMTPSQYKNTITTGYQLYKTDPSTPCGGGGGGPCDNSASILFRMGNVNPSTKDFDFDFWGNGFPIAKTEDLNIDGVAVSRAFTTESRYPTASIYKLSPTSQLYVTSEFFPQNENQSQYFKDTINEINLILSSFKYRNLNQTSNSKQIGYIKSISPNYDNYKFVIDYVNFVNNNTAPNGYKIENPSTETTTLYTDVPGTEPEVIMQTYSNAADGNFNFNQKITFSQFLDTFNSNSSTKNSLYWIEAQNGTITKITEQYQP